jgi:hypothetical protein
VQAEAASPDDGEPGEPRDRHPKNRRRTDAVAHEAGAGHDDERQQQRSQDEQPHEAKKRLDRPVPARLIGGRGRTGAAAPLLLAVLGRSHPTLRD